MTISQDYFADKWDKWEKCFVNSKSTHKYKVL